MDDAYLVELANRIGERYAALPCHEESVAAVEQHLLALWPAGWRQQLAAWLAAHAQEAGEGRAAAVDETVAEALARCATQPDTGKQE